MKVKVSIIIVYYKGRKILIDCLRSIKQHKTKYSYEVIVVDNSRRKSIEGVLKRKFKRVKYIKSSSNLGYGAGNNLGASVAKGDYLLILNPDTKVLKGAIDELVNYLDKNKMTAVVAPNLLTRKNKLFKKMGSGRLTPLRGIFTLSFINKLFPNNKYSRKYYLTDIDQEKLREIDSVPGSAFMIRKKVFEKIGMFDEKIFMFFEEEDLGKRIQDLGYKIVINPKAKIVHYWVSSKKSKKLTSIYNQSRFYYFKKHYGVIAASIVELFARFSKWHLAVILITLLGAFLRFYRIEENLVFGGELGHNYLAIKNFINNRQVPLLGPPTSHPWLSFGPLFYWIFGPILAVGGYGPLIGAYFFAFIGSLLIVVNFIVIKKLFDNKVALISSFLISVSPAFLQLTRGSRFFSFVPLFFYPFIFFLVKSLKKDGKYLVWVGFFLGVMLNFHLTPIILIPPTLVLVYFCKKTIKAGDVLKVFFGLLIPTLPFLLHNFLSGFNMLTKLVIWVPYRIAGFVGFLPKNQVNFDIVKSNFSSLFNFISEGFVPENGLLGMILVLFVIIFIVAETKVRFRVKTKSIEWITIVLIFVFGYAGIFMHGDPPSHYYLPLYPIPIILFSIFLSKAAKKYESPAGSRPGHILPALRLPAGKAGREQNPFEAKISSHSPPDSRPQFSAKGDRPIFVILILVFITYTNLNYYFSDRWFYGYKGRLNYALQKEISKYIFNDARGKYYEIKRVGPFDYFEGNFAQNYQYLLWLNGNEPVRTGDIVISPKDPQIEYIIYEDIDKLPEKTQAEVFWVENIAIVKNIIQ